jgi:hypothetical protein
VKKASSSVSRLTAGESSASHRHPRGRCEPPATGIPSPRPFRVDAPRRQGPDEVAFATFGPRTTTMPDEKVSLADHIRDKLDAGLLPRVLPGKMGTGYGRGNSCDGCGDPINPAQVEYEFRIEGDSDHVFRLHIGCLGCGWPSCGVAVS